jgi:hypothetical protein
VYWVDFGLDDVGAWGEFDGKAKYRELASAEEKSAADIVAEEKARHDFNLVRLIENLASAGLDDLKLAVAGRREFSEIARIMDFRLKKTGEKP